MAEQDKNNKNKNLEKDIKLIAIDLDDTLLNDKLEVSARAVKAITKAKELGVQVTIATGRMYQAALPYAKQLGLDVPLITYQGALVKNSLSGEVLVHKPVPLALAQEIIRLARKKSFHINIYVDDKLYVEKINDEVLSYSRLSRVSINPVDDLLEFLKEDPAKVLIIAEEKDILKLKGEVQEKFQELHITTSKPYFLEFLNHEATKANALEYLAGQYSIDSQEIMAIGDSYNDLEMLDYAGLSIVMGNAREEVKKHADFVGPSNVEDGVAEVIEKFVLQGGD